ncbi:Uncharacterised protein [Serratia marcescens]|uniref:DUF6414 family protein n=1 Tax=Serratia TaxID=613 RepID=UPI0018D79FF7|nr:MULTISPECIES: hypothetical protein [Serratia]MBH2533838.1 hypothetical protein [Serratia marcescens]MDI6977542.1 hypothetical protein [Serratia sp. Se-RSBMAAmG]MDI9262420.1 hypothetical protein [Serratia sp. PF2-63]MDI9271273.1 hypothetical protein [Serratia sp. PF-27]CAI1747039.1 Uncharacterised protein [Serratia marcescens]
MDQESQNTNSLYDYLYIDRERISALTAQLFSTGVITSVKQSSQESDSLKKDAKIGIPLVAGALSAAEAVSRSQERFFDSSWSLPLNLLDKLSEQGRIRRSLEGARLGDLVLVSGMMKIFDANMVHQFMPTFKKIKLAEIKNAKSQSIKNSLKEEVKGLEAAEEMVKFLPTSSQIDFADSEGNQIWMSVNPSNLTIGMGDIALKYGPFIPGEWHILGFLDAYADDQKLDNPDAPYPHNLNDLKSAMDSMLLIIKTLMGRVTGSFGMTPLIIFRTVT